MHLVTMHSVNHRTTPCQACSTVALATIARVVFHLASFSLLFSGIYYIGTYVYALCEKMVAALIITGKYGTETAAHNTG